MATFSISGTRCCGLFELSNISALPDAETVVKQVATNMAGPTNGYRSNPAFLMFTGVVGKRQRVYETYSHADRDDDYGQALADYITANDLGNVDASTLSQNYNGNMLRVWLWAPNWEALSKIWDGSRPSSLSVTPSVTLTSPF